ncbi:MAG: methyltransferase dimerization domain-containing protein [Myxococcaceae bacterium]
MSASFVQTLNFCARDASNESAALQAARTLGLLDALRDAPAGVTLASLSSTLASKPRGVRALLEVLVGLGFVRFDGDTYALTQTSAEFLADAGFRKRLDEASGWWTASALLPDAVRTGSSAEARDLLEWFEQRFSEVGSPAARGSAEDFYDRFARSFLRTQVLVAASRVGLLEALAQGPSQHAALEERLELSSRGLEVLLGALQRMEIVVASREDVRFTEQAAYSLDPKSLPYFERALPATMVYWEGLGQLADAVKTGRFVLDLKRPEIAAKIYGENASRITGIFASHLRLGRHAVQLVKQMRSLAGARILDVGTGSGVWGAAFAEGDPSAQVTFLDSEQVLTTVRENLARVKLLERARLWAADCTQVELGEAAWDVILLPQILPVLQPHEREDFWRRVGRALAPGGVVAISGYVLSDLRDGPMDAIYFSLRRYMTNEGDVLSLPEMRRELGRVGLGEARLYPLPVQELVLATRGNLPWPAGAPDRA